MNKQKIFFILAVIVLSFLISPFWYSFLRYQKILHNASCGKSKAPCAYEIIPPSLWEMITNKSSIKMRPPCNPYATTTDCVPTPPPPLPEATTTPQIQTGKIDEHLTINTTLRDVNFCGKIYKAKQVIIDGVDVVQRIAELATKDLMPKDFKGRGHRGEVVCRGIYSADVQGILDVHVNIVPKTYSEKGNSLYTMNVSGVDFVINATTNEIHLIEGFSGGSIGLVGLLK